MKAQDVSHIVLRKKEKNASNVLTLRMESLEELNFSMKEALTKTVTFKV